MVISMSFLSESQTIVVLIGFMSIISPVASCKTETIVSDNLILSIT